MYFLDIASIAHQLNTHFINVGRDLADKLPYNKELAMQYIKRSFRQSFTFRGISTDEVCDLIMGIRLSK